MKQHANIYLFYMLVLFLAVIGLAIATKSLSKEMYSSEQAIKGTQQLPLPQNLEIYYVINNPIKSHLLKASIRSVVAEKKLQENFRGGGKNDPKIKSVVQGTVAQTSVAANLSAGYVNQSNALLQNQVETIQSINSEGMSALAAQQQLLNGIYVFEEKEKDVPALAKDYRDMQPNVPVIPSVVLRRITEPGSACGGLDFKAIREKLNKASGGVSAVARRSDWDSISFYERKFGCLKKPWTEFTTSSLPRCARAAGKYFYIDDSCHILANEPDEVAFDSSKICANPQPYYQLYHVNQLTKVLVNKETPQYDPLRFNSYMHYVDVLDLNGVLQQALSDKLCQGATPEAPATCNYEFSGADYSVLLFGTRYGFKETIIKYPSPILNLSQRTLRLPWDMLLHRPVFVKDIASKKLYSVRIPDGQYGRTKDILAYVLPVHSLLNAPNINATSGLRMTEGPQNLMFYSLHSKCGSSSFQGIVSMSFVSETDLSYIYTWSGIFKLTFQNKEFVVSYENKQQQSFVLQRIPLIDHDLGGPVEPIGVMITFMSNQTVAVYGVLEKNTLQVRYDQRLLLDRNVTQTLFRDIFTNPSFTQPPDGRLRFDVQDFSVLVPSSPPQNPMQQLFPYT